MPGFFGGGLGDSRYCCRFGGSLHHRAEELSDDCGKVTTFIK